MWEWIKNIWHTPHTQPMPEPVIINSEARVNIPTICLVDKTTEPLGFTMEDLRAALQIQVSRDFYPIWGLDAKIDIGEHPEAGHWNLVFVDKADVDNALGYHSLTFAGLPIGFVFTQTSIEFGENPTVTASHEVLEMLADPAINLWAQHPNQTMWAYEVCDAVEAETYEIGRIEVSDFQYPAYFEGFRETGPYDFMGKVSKPFQILKGGYSLISSNGQIGQIFSSRIKSRNFKKEDRRGHRSEYRVPLSTK